MNPGKNTQINKPEEIKGIGMGTRFATNTGKSYSISRGKSSIFRKGMLLFVSAVFLTLISLTLFHFDPEKDPAWMEYLLWTPRLISIILVIIGVMKLRSTTEIKPFMQFQPEGILYDEELIPWDKIDIVDIEQSVIDDSYFAIILEIDGKRKELDISKVDEFSEDVVVVLTRYLEKYRPLKPEDRT